MAMASRISSEWHSNVVRVLLLSRIDDSMYPFEEDLFVVAWVPPAVWLLALPEARGLLEEPLFAIMVNGWFGFCLLFCCVIKLDKYM